MKSTPPKFAVLLLLLAGQSAFAQSAAISAVPKTVSNDEAVQLPAFEIKSDNDTGYVGKSALSSTRIAVDLIDVPQSVKVLNNAFLLAVNPLNVSDMLNYVGGAQSGQILISPGRVNIRGFTGDADYVDGFAPTANSNPESAMFDRFEVIKGPSSIFLAADGSPGGIVNKITKSPSSVRATSITGQAGLYDANGVNVDTTGAVTGDGRLLYRVIVAERYAPGYYDNWYTHRFSVMPALSFQFNPETKLVVKGLVNRALTGDFGGLPIDPRTLRIFDLPRSQSSAAGTPGHWRHDLQKRLWFSLTSRLSDAVAVRLGGMTASNEHTRQVGTPVTWNDTKNASAVLNYNGTQSFPRTSTADDTVVNYRDLQGDMNINFHTGPANHNLLIGGELRASPQRNTTFQSSDTAWNPYFPIPDVFTVDYSKVTISTASHDSNQRLFAMETLKLFRDTLLLSFGVSRSKSSADQLNALTGVFNTPNYALFKNLKQWGTVYKVLPNVSLFTGYNENFATNGVGLVNGVSGVLPPKQGKQTEVGLKVADLLKHRLSFNVAYFDILQTNNTVPSAPNDPKNPKILIPGVISRGFDGDLTYQVTPEFSLMGTFSLYHAKSVLGPAAAAIVQPYYGAIRTGSIPVDNNAEQAASLFAAYTFRVADLKGLSASLGTNYLSKRAITDNANQLMFGYMPGRTLLQLNLRYRQNRHWSYSFNVDNLLNARYIYSARNENSIDYGAPTNLKFSATYTF